MQGWGLVVGKALYPPMIIGEVNPLQCPDQECSLMKSSVQGSGFNTHIVEQADK